MRRHSIFCLLLFATGCYASDLAGSWVGTTTQEKPTIRFSVARGGITELSLKWVLPLAEPCLAASEDAMSPGRLSGAKTWYFNPNSRGNEPLRISENGWQGTLSADTQDDVQIIITAAFVSDNTASGSLDLSSKKCNARFHTAWNAAKKPPQSPVLLAARPSNTPADVARPQAVGTDGAWIGTMAEDKPIIRFTVTGTAVTQLGMEWVLPLTAPCVLSAGSAIAATTLGGDNRWYFHAGSVGNEPPKITGTSWRSTVNAGGPGEVEVTITGNFRSATEAFGIVELHSKVCNSNSRAEWKAAKRTPST